MKVSLSDRLTNLPVSSIRKLTHYAAIAKAEGVKIYHLNIGDPDIKTPDVMLQALHDFPQNPIRYADSKGELVLRDSLLWYYQHLGFSFLDREQLIVTVGGSEALLFAFYAVAEPGDEVLVFEPYYSNYASCAAFMGIKLRAVPTTIDTGFHLPSKKIIESYITKKTKALLICTPGNPTGTVYSKEEMQLLVNIARKHNLFLISDEVYREFIYDKEQTSLLSFMQEIPEHAILLDSLSKRYSLCGARLGVFMSLNANLMQGIVKLTQSRLSAGLIEQVMAAQLTEVPSSWLKTVQKEYKKRRDVLYKELKTIKGVKMSKPEGAFYTMLTLPVDDAEKFCIFLLQKFRINNETVMLAPGAGFYEHEEKGKKQVRFAYVLNIKDLKKSITIIKAALKTYNNS